MLRYGKIPDLIKISWFGGITQMKIVYFINIIIIKKFYTDEYILKNKSLNNTCKILYQNQK